MNFSLENILPNVRKPLEKLIGRAFINIQHVIKSLTYFEDADKGEMPDMYVSVRWPAVKSFFRGERLSLAKKFFGI